MQMGYHAIGAVLAYISPKEDEDSLGSKIMKKFHFYAVSISFPVAIVSFISLLLMDIL